MVYIDVPDLNDSYSRVVLDGKEFLLRFTYNATFDYWSFGVYDLNQSPILGLVKIVPNFPLAQFYAGRGLPDGIFGAVTEDGRIGRDSFLSKKARFVFIPTSDLED